MNRITPRFVLLTLSILVVAVVLVSGCGPKKTLEETATETFGAWTSKVNGTTFSFTKPGTLIFTFSNAFDELSPQEQRTFMTDVGEKWEEVAGGRVEKESDLKVVFEDNMGNVIYTYAAGKGLKKE